MFSYYYTGDMSQSRDRYHGSSSTQSSGTLSGKLIAIAAVLMVVAFAVAFATYLRNNGPQDVSISFVGSERLDDSTMRVWADVARKDVDQQAFCIVTALNYSMAEVGRTEFLVPAGGHNNFRYEIDIPTYEAAHAGKVYGCGTDVPFYLSAVVE